MFNVFVGQSQYKNMSISDWCVLTSPATAAVAVAIAGMILPAMRLVLSLSAGSMEYILALRADADATKSMWPLLSSSFSNSSGLICSLSTDCMWKHTHYHVITQ